MLLLRLPLLRLLLQIQLQPRHGLLQVVNTADHGSHVVLLCSSDVLDGQRLLDWEKCSPPLLFHQLSDVVLLSSILGWVLLLEINFQEDVVPHVMVVTRVSFKAEAMLFEHISIDAADKAFFLLILAHIFRMRAHLGEGIDNNATQLK